MRRLNKLELGRVSYLMQFVTSPAGAVTKYYDEYVCLCVCLSVSEHISPES